MMLKKIELAVNAVMILSSLLAVVYTIGVVWRVEKKLDISYKLFLVSILAFLAAVIIEKMYPIQDQLTIFSADVMKMLFAVFYLAGIWTMRDMIRRMDGEK
jgi:hypothetical protein